MATEAPDPRTFKSWEDAFQYPIPIVRKLECQLRSNADENREKLRSLVGSSYRSLLDTAETIIDMEVRMQQVESKLAKIGHNCNLQGLDKLAHNAVKMDNQNRHRDMARYTFASQLAVLRSCPVVMARLMKTGSSYLLIAKVLVISRLIHKALSQSKNKPPIVNQLRDRLGSMREKLLRRINRRLASSAEDPSALIESMCAYSLATSSTPTDILRHFHKVRMEAIVGSLQYGEGLAKRGTEALKLCLQTCQDTQAIFPRRLAESLAKLKAQPLVQDPEVRALYDLNLDIHDRWIGDEARNYTPWPRHEGLQRSEAEKLLHQWSKQAISAFLKGIKTALEQAKELREVASLRQELVEIWILSGSRMAGVKSANVLEDIRDTMNSQLETIIRSRAQGLQTVVSELTSILDIIKPDPKGATTSLWDATSTLPELSNGAEAFKSMVLNTHQGRTDAVIRVVSAFENWMQSVLEVKGIVKTMKETRWDDTFAEDVDDSDDEFGESKQTLLSDDDPRLLEDVTQEALSDALEGFGKSFARIVNQVISNDNSLLVSRAVFVLRVLREIGDRLQRLRLNDKATSPTTPFTSTVLKPLHTALAEQSVQPAITIYQSSLISAIKSRSKSPILWEGSPAIPAQPSPSAFRFLQTLVTNMGAYGSDLWSPDCVYVLKSLASLEAYKVWQVNFEAIRDLAETAKQSDGSVDEAGGPEEKDVKAKEQIPSVEVIKVERLKQLLFDLLFVRRYLSSSENAEALTTLLRAVQEAASVDDAQLTRLKEKASDYGRKTYLLFALLA